MPGTIWNLLKQTVGDFIEDEALTRGAAIAFYAITSIGPLLLIVVSIAGMAFGREAAQNALVGEFKNVMGAQTAELLQSILSTSADKTAGILSTLGGAAMLVVTASGTFGEMQGALNKIWKVEARPATISRFIRARAASAGLVAALGFLLLASLVVSTLLSGLGQWLDTVLPNAKWIALALTNLFSFAIVAVLFAAIYKVLPDRRLEWRDVAIGAISTSALFTIGKFLIGWYLATTAAASGFGAAGGLILLLLWIYYSVQIFLLGAEFTKSFSQTFGSRRTEPALAPKSVEL